MDEAQQPVETGSPRESHFRRTSSYDGASKRKYLPITRSARIVDSESRRNIRQYTERRVNIGSGFSFSLGTLVIIISVLVILVGPSLLQLANQYDARNKAFAELKLAETRNQRLHEELENWNDSAFVIEQARQRLGFVKPGEVRYIVLNEKGKTVGGNPVGIGQAVKRPWFLLIASSVEAAGNHTEGVNSENNLNPDKGTPAPGANEGAQKKKKPQN